MQQHIRGIKCSLDYYQLADFLKYLFKKNWIFHVPWCMLDANNITVQDHTVSKEDISMLDKHRIWELELQCTPQNTIQADIVDYQDFCNSVCECFVLYYDCGFFEMYIKQSTFVQEFWGVLEGLAAEDMMIITDANDTRKKLTV